MTTRTELIAELREYKYTLMARAADMLEADAKRLELACTTVQAMGFSTGNADNVWDLMNEVEWQVRELRETRNKLKEAARLALDALEKNMQSLVAGVTFDMTTEAIAALKGVLK